VAVAGLPAVEQIVLYFSVQLDPLDGYDSKDIPNGVKLVTLTGS